MNLKNISLVASVLVVLLPITANAQFDLGSPSDGAELTSAPTFGWTGGGFDAYLFYSVFSYAGFGYYPVSFWLAQTSLPMPETWWDALDEGVDSYWAVIGLNTTTFLWEVTGAWSFKKVQGDMMSIPGGCFDMGDAFSEGAADELPVHNVCISAFDMDKHEVTNTKYAACVAAEACTPPVSSTSESRATYYGDPAYDNFPVIWVDWQQAQDYCTWEGKRLPSEAEWEYATRGGLSGNRYPWGNSISGSNANYWNSGDPWDNDTSPVGNYPPNDYGLFDTAGNVWEWVNDWYQSSYYAVSPQNDPPGPASGTDRVLRGGSFLSVTLHMRAPHRDRDDPDFVDSIVGFRCAR